MFSYELCELFKSTYFVDDLRTAGSETPEWGWSNGKLEEGIHKPVQSGVIMKIRWKLHCGHTYTDLGIERERKGRTEKLVKVG